MFIGHDLPAVPAQVTLVATDAYDTHLTWTAPTAGMNGGWIDSESLAYAITRLPDSLVLEENFKGTEYTDTSIENLAAYSYQVQAVTSDGKGGIASTDKVVLGSALTLPYNCTFTTEDEFLLWNIIDNNRDGATWRPETMPPSVRYYYNEDGETGADDWLISSPIRLEAGRNYRLSFYMKSQGEDYPEKVDVYLGTGAAVADQTTLLQAYTVTDYDFQEYRLMLPTDLASGNYRVSFHCHSDPNMYDVNIKDLLLEEVSQGGIAGVVTDGTQPLDAVTVTLVGTDHSTLSDTEGQYVLAELPDGNYTVRFEKEGYQTQEQADITVTFGETTEANATLAALPTFAVSGRVLNADNQPVEKAQVTLDGYTLQHAESAADGTFTFPHTYQADGYLLVVQRYGLCSDTLTLDVADANVSVDDVILKDKPLSPYMVQAEAADNQATITWQTPMDLRQFRHDNGQHGGRIGSPYATSRSVYGAVFRTPAKLTGMTWFTENYLQEHHAVNVFVFGLDAEGNPTAEVLYSQTDVPNTDMTWCSIDFPQPIDAPNGYMLALSYEGHVGLGLDTEGADAAYPFAERTQCYSADYTTGQFNYLEGDGIRRSCMIRGVGILAGEDELPSATTGKKYSVWRLLDGQTEQPELWQQLTTEPVAALAYVDNDWNAQPQGIYRYAVRTEYASGVQSPAAFSPAVAKDMLTQLTLKVSTNTPENEAAGAAVTLTDNAGHSYGATADAEGQAIITGVWKGSYDLLISKRGFNDYRATGIDLSTENQYEKADCLLEEYVVAPFNLEIAQDGDDEWVFNWNVTEHLFDDFEGHDDFAVNSPGTIGWTYIDGDGAETYGIDGVDFANATSPKAYIVFNPYETDPNITFLDPNTLPHSGEKYLAAFPAIRVENNDFLISPELSFNSDFTLSFYAKSYTEDYGKELMNVGYSTGGNAADDFTWLNGDTPVEVPMGDWTPYRYTIPANARYVAINCVSYNVFMLMIDDIFIGREIPEGIQADNIRPDLSFEVYLDGELVATDAASTHRFTGLQPGAHRAGVKAVFASATTDLVEIPFQVVGGTGLQAPGAGKRLLYPNPANDHICITGQYDEIAIFDLSGKEMVRQNYQPQINVQELPEGIYMVKIMQNDGQNDVMKLVIDR